MRIVSVQGVLPEHRYTQAELTHAFTHEMLARHGERVGGAALPRERLRRARGTRRCRCSGTPSWPTSPSPTTRSSRSGSSSAPAR